MPSAAYENILSTFDVVTVPFPFTDMPRIKRRPALVISGHAFHRSSSHAVLAMITTAKAGKWESDVAIRNREIAGLPERCVVRAKLFTLDLRLVIRKIGHLAPGDRASVRAALSKILALK